MEWQRQLEEEDNIIIKWAQEDVETLYSLLNNNNNNNNSSVKYNTGEDSYLLGYEAALAGYFFPNSSKDLTVFIFNI